MPVHGAEHAREALRRAEGPRAPDRAQRRGHGARASAPRADAGNGRPNGGAGGRRPAKDRSCDQRRLIRDLLLRQRDEGREADHRTDGNEQNLRCRCLDAQRPGADVNDFPAPVALAPRLAGQRGRQAERHQAEQRDDRDGERGPGVGREEQHEKAEDGGPGGQEYGPDPSRDVREQANVRGVRLDGIVGKGMHLDPLQMSHPEM